VSRHIMPTRAFVAEGLALGCHFFKGDDGIGKFLLGIRDFLLQFLDDVAPCQRASAMRRYSPFILA